MVNGYDVQRECFVLRTASGWITLVGARKGKFYVSLAVLCICLVFRCRGIGIEYSIRIYNKIVVLWIRIQ